MKKKESDLAKAIKAFCVPRREKGVRGDGLVVYDVSCPDWGCMMEGDGGDTKETFKHAECCPLSLLTQLGDGPELHKRLALDAHDLDYEGGGYNSCPTCKGYTKRHGVNPKHRKNCPAALAHKTAPDEWFREPAEVKVKVTGVTVEQRPLSEKTLKRVATGLKKFFGKKMKSQDIKCLMAALRQQHGGKS